MLTNRELNRLVSLRDSDPEKWTYRKLGEKFERSEATVFHHYKKAKEGESGNSATRKPTKKEIKTETALESRIASSQKSKDNNKPGDVCLVTIDGPDIYMECQIRASKTQELVAAIINTAKSRRGVA